MIHGNVQGWPHFEHLFWNKMSCLNISSILSYIICGLQSVQNKDIKGITESIFNISSIDKNIGVCEINDVPLNCCFHK